MRIVAHLSYAIVAEYDSLNRVTRRIVLQVTYASFGCHSPVGLTCEYSTPILEAPTLCSAIDTARFTAERTTGVTERQMRELNRRTDVGVRWSVAGVGNLLALKLAPRHNP